MTKAERSRTYARNWVRRAWERKIAEANRGARLCQRKHGGNGKCLGRLTHTITRDGQATQYCERCARFTAGLCAHCPNPVNGMMRRARYCAWCQRRQLADARKAFKTRHPDEVREQSKASNKRRRAQCTEARRHWKAKNPGRDKQRRIEREQRKKLAILRRARGA